jgi:hypothetical protein
MAYRRTTEQRDRRLTRIRHIAQAIAVVAGVGGGVGVGYVAQSAVPAGAANHTSVTTVHAPVTHAKAATPVVQSTSASTPVAVPVTTPTVCTTSPSGTVTCH